MKRRGFLKMLGIGAAVPVVAQLPESNAEIVRRQLIDNATLASKPSGFTPKYVADPEKRVHMCMTAIAYPQTDLHWTAVHRFRDD